MAKRYISNEAIAKIYYDEKIADARYSEDAEYHGKNLKGAYHFNNSRRFHSYRVGAENIKNLKIELCKLYLQNGNLHVIKRMALSDGVINDLERILEEKTGIETKPVTRKINEREPPKPLIVLARRIR